MAMIFSVGDLRQTVRRLVRERGFTSTVLLTLALCVAANVAIFALVDAIVIRALPYPHADELVTAINSYPGAGADRVGASLPNYYDRRVAIKAFASTAIRQGGSAIVGESGSPRRVPRDRVSPEFFATLGVPLAMGRTFNEDEMFYKGSGVAILTDAFWRTKFNADPEVLGRKFDVDGSRVTVIGVLPPGFRYLSSRAQFFIPTASNVEDRGVENRHGNNYDMIARLAPGATLTTAQAQLDALNHQQLADDPHAELLKNARYHTEVYSLHADHIREVRPMLLVLQGGVLFLLLIGSVNLVNLLLIRASGRAKEHSVRQALGASRRHIVGEVMLETVLLALGGGVLGLGLGGVSISLLATLGTEQLPLGATVAFDGRVAVIALSGSLLVGVALALPIIWFHLQHTLAPGLQAETRGGTVGRAAQRVRHGFIVTQIALAFLLLTGAGLLGVSLKKIMATSPGFDSEQVLTGQISLPWNKYPETKPRLAFIERLLVELRAQPGITFAGLTSALPFTGNADDSATSVEGADLAPGKSIRTHYTSAAVGDYLQALGVPLIEGRFLEDADNHREVRVCVVDQDVAQRYWPGQSALGRRLVNGPTFNEAEAVTIVGVVGNVKQKDLSDPVGLGAIYFPFQYYSRTDLSVVIRTPLNPASLAAALQRIVLKLDPELPIDDLKIMQARVENSLVARRSPAVLAAIYSGVALLLAAVGTYGVLAYAIRQRRREIGVRMALGALPAQVRDQFLGLGLRLLLAGLTLGMVGAWAVGLAMRNVLFGVGLMHPGVCALTGVVMTLVVLGAVYLPSRRASRINPLEALRDE
jgi:predicted permease